MDYESDVGFIDPHSKRVRCRDHGLSVKDEVILVFDPVRIAHPGMIPCRGNSGA